MHDAGLNQQGTTMQRSTNSLSTYAIKRDHVSGSYYIQSFESFLLSLDSIRQYFGNPPRQQYLPTMAFSPPSIPPDEHLGELLRLPNEILDTIASHLSNRDIKKLRLTCRSLCEKAHLRLSRVFISANPRNIEVLYSIANHERFRMNVTEIIWDDATLTKWWTSEEYRMEGDDEMDEWERWDQWDDKHECPRWFAEACCYELDAIRSRKGFDGPRPEHIAREKIIKAKMPLAACWKVYQQLLDEQDDVMISKSDAHAFR